MTSWIDPNKAAKRREGIALEHAHIAFYETLKQRHAELGPDWPVSRIEAELARHRGWLAGMEAEDANDLA